ncbi:MAG TPA: AzlD domain-containing protein [Aggregatilineales bacterium]|nr:AzlD domain-containing protein [Aggregatilineales bacterium]
MTIWLIILGMSIVTYGTRLLPLTLIDEEALPYLARRGLVYVPVAVLSAIIGPGFVPGKDWLHYTVDAHLLAGMVAIAVAWYTRNTIITIILGMVVLVLLS